jgi:hypothetical protein
MRVPASWVLGKFVLAKFLDEGVLARRFGRLPALGKAPLLEFLVPGRFFEMP